MSDKDDVKRYEYAQGKAQEALMNAQKAVEAELHEAADVECGKAADAIHTLRTIENEWRKNERPGLV